MQDKQESQEIPKTPDTECYVGVDVPLDTWLSSKSMAALERMPVKQFVAEALLLRIAQHVQERGKA